MTYSLFTYGAAFSSIRDIIGTLVSLFINSGLFIYFLLLYINQKKGKEDNFNKYYLLTALIVGLVSSLLNNPYGYVNVYGLLIISAKTIINIACIVCMYKLFFNKINTDNKEKITKILVTVFLISLLSTVISIISCIGIGMSILSFINIILSIITNILLIHFFNYYDIHYNNLFKDGNEEVQFKLNIGEWKKYIIIAIAAVIIMNLYSIVGILSTIPSSGGSSKSKWDSLTKEEKQWYERNYGGGKSEAYDKAIKDYQKNH